VSEIAKDIVKKWKNDVEKAKRTTGGAAERNPPSTSKPGACLAIAGVRLSLTALCSAEETGCFSGHSVQAHLRFTVRLFPCNSEGRGEDRQG
jgi:hypothetical protein